MISNNVCPKILVPALETVNARSIGDLQGLGIRDTVEDLEALACPLRVGLPLIGALAGLEPHGVDETTALAAKHKQSFMTAPANATLRKALDAMDRNETDAAVIR